MKRCAGYVALAELRPEPRILNELGRGRVVGMGILPVGSEKKSRLDPPEHGGQGATMRQGGFEIAIGQTEILAPRMTEYGIGGGGFGLTDLQRAEWGRLAGRQVEDTDLPTTLNQLGNRATHADLGIVRVGSYDEGVKHDQVSLIDQGEVGKSSLHQLHKPRLSSGYLNNESPRASTIGRKLYS